MSRSAFDLVQRLLSIGIMTWAVGLDSAAMAIMGLALYLDALIGPS